MARDLSKYNGKGLAPLTEMKVEAADNRHTDIEQTVIEAYREPRRPVRRYALHRWPMSRTS